MGLIQGQQDRPLSPNGFKQRRNLFFHLQVVPLAKIYCNSLRRTLQTAQPLCEENKIPIIIVPELNEAKLGVFEGEQSRTMYQDFQNFQATEYSLQFTDPEGFSAQAGAYAEVYTSNKLPGLSF